MGLFNFLSSQLLKNIDWLDNTSETMVYKYPMEGRNIMIGSKLTVRESQVAIFMVKGKIADVFTAGIHTLIVNNLPILSSLLAWPRGFKAPFTADVFFVNTKQFTNQKWGTTNPIVMRDKDFGSIRIKSFGTFAFKVNDAKTFLHELFGTSSLYTTENIVTYLKSMLVAGISDTIAESKISALDLACNLLEFNKMAKEQIKEQFTSLGLDLTNLVIENISFPEQVEKAIDTQTSMGVMKNSMDTYIKFKSAEAIGDAAKNPGGMAGLGSQLGAGMAIGEIVKDSLKTSTKKDENEKEVAPTDKSKFCPECGAKNTLRARFCVECGHKFSPKEKPTCPNCGAEISQNTKFCPECGKKVK
ncbi:MAG: zinc-ribbon domain-containing protein [Clostridia bacterium]|nr:zinc-ribbon domain-containing protein [Clostridia bacterium]